MKKILAVVLCLAMLLSCVVIGISAARVATKTEETTTNHYWNFPAGNYYNPVEGVNATNYDVEMDVMLSDADSCITGWDGLTTGPVLTTSAMGIGQNSATASVAVSLDTGVWYHVKWAYNDGSYDLYLNGAKVGSVEGSMNVYSGSDAYYKWIKVAVDNVKIGSLALIDFESDAENAISNGQGAKAAVDDTTVTYTNDNVFQAPIDGDYVYQFTARSERYYMAWKVGNFGWASANYTSFEFDVRADSPLAEAGDWLGGAFKMSVPNGNIGIASTLPFSWTVGQWYHVQLVGYVANGASLVYVDGALVGEGVVSGLPLSNYTSGGYWCGPNNNISYNNFKFSTSADLATWETIFTEDFNDKNLPNDDSGDSGAQYVLNVADVAVDLGLQYYYFPSGNYYNPVENVKASGYDVEMDVMLSDANANISGWSGLTTGPVITTSSMGVGQELSDAKTVAYDFEVGEWYHVKWAKTDAGYDLYVDGTKIGSVEGSMSVYDGSDAYFKWNLVGVDNVKIAGLDVMDFETDAANALVGGQGKLTKYDFSYLDKSVYELIGAENNVTTSGTGLLINGTYDSNYGGWYAPSAKTESDVYINFDLAMTQHSNDLNTIETPYFDFWLGEANARLHIAADHVGKNVGNAQDFVSFDWGELSPTHFRNVLITLKGSYNVLEIAIDGVTVYTGTIGVSFTGSGYNGNKNLGLLGMSHATSIVANYKVYNMDLKELDNPLKDLQNNGNLVTGTVDLAKLGDAASCSHTPGITTTTRATTCHTKGEQKIACALCGTEYATKSIAKSAHKYTKYDINNLTEDGLVSVKCANEGCTDAYYSTVPANYTGTLNSYFDMSDALICKTFYDNANVSQFVFEDGVGKTLLGKWDNYHQFDIPTASMRPDANNWSTTFDASVLRVDDEAAKSNYGGSFYIWTGGASGIGMHIGYNAVTEEVYISGTGISGNGKDSEGQSAYTAPYKMNIGETYTFKVSYEYDEDEMTGGIKIYINGDLILKYTDEEDEEICYILPYGKFVDNGKLTMYIYRVFNIDVSLDNWAVGSADFAETDRVYKGDADGDFALTTADATMIRMLLAGCTDTVTCMSRVDFNGDGKVNAKDLLGVRKLLVA